MRKLIVALLALMMMVQICAVGASASDYTYTVRIYAGNRGDINGGSVVVYNNVPYGSTVSFDLGSVTVNDARYYAQGIRYSGQDNDALQPTSITVTGDVDYVVAYGIAGTLVPYTVNYQDADGTTLAESQTYYGNVGEKPVVAFLYIEDYVPQAYNLTKTLSENPAENVFTFVYTSLITVVTENSTATMPDDVDADDDAGADAEAGDAGAAEDAEDAEPVDEAADVELEDIEEDDTPLLNGPQELVDLDEDDTPTGNILVVDDDATRISSGRMWGSLAILSAALLGLGWLVLFVWKKRNNKEEEEAQEL